MSRKIEISHRTVVSTVILLIGLWVLFLVRQVIVEVFVALLIMTVLNPLVSKLSKYRIPRSVSVLVVYLILFGILSYTLASVASPLLEETSALINGFPEFMTSLGISAVVSNQILEQFISQIGTLPAKAYRLTISLFSNVLSVVSVLVFAFYFLSERERLDDQLAVFFGERKKQKIARAVDKLESQLGGWARGQFILMLVVGIFNYVGLKLLGIPFALPLAILAGLLEIVPYLGPIFAAIPAAIIGFATLPVIGVAVVSLAFLVQQLENYVLVPKIMQKSAGVNPVVTLFALAIGFRLAGVVGLLISVPVFIATRVVMQEYLVSKG